MMWKIYLAPATHATYSREIFYPQIFMRESRTFSCTRLNGKTAINRDGELYVDYWENYYNGIGSNGKLSSGADYINKFT